ncbi:MAG TPA: DUF4407 domain-containing protein [Prolixibacteraceae bacterium]|nr:DUF4407 domain-containing protein [Prolixibacteraceae bacterium]
MNDLWVRFGCFMTGYNYSIVRNSSEASVKAVKKYLSALLIVCTLWGFVGYAFTQRYLHGNWYVSLIGALIMVLMVIQIERQIILSIGRNRMAYTFRILIGIVMAVLGSVILDQIIFKDDVEKLQISNIQEEVNRLLPVKTKELTMQIQQLDSSISSKEQERAKIIDEISKKPMIYSPTTTNLYRRDTISGQLKLTNKTVTGSSIPNPKAEMIPSIDAQIKYLVEQRTLKETGMLNIRDVLEKDLRSKTGFLDELKVLFTILFNSGIAFTMWALIFLFFLAIELFVLVNKFGDSKNDYDKTIVHQMEMRMKMLEKLDDQPVAGNKF